MNNLTYPCPECDHQGPHHADDYDGVLVVECCDCYAEFEVDQRDAS